MKKTYSIATATILGLAAATSAKAAVYGGVSWTPYGNDNGPGVLITYTGGTTINITATGQGPYDGSDDTYVGVINNSTQVLSSVFLTGNNIFGFDGDGISNPTYGRPTPSPVSDSTGYAGPGTSYSVVNANSGTVFFTGGLQPGATAYFSLEENLSGATGGSAGGGLTGGAGTAPDAGSSMVLLGGALAGIGALRRRIK